ncbi:hypothetical protein [Pseudoduganella violaceinigra]|uniref:hypothetical protein n=1 Tax=Pseudoduganella violaceinigra TaxID=246602 RepID=UPI0012B62DC6|nr:hypothetical protein [Pseudoduganella violaceinigra]
MRRIYWGLLFLQMVIFGLLEHAGLAWLRITEFGASGDPGTWGAIVVALNIGFALTYLAALVISSRSRTLLDIAPLRDRLAHLGMTLGWPVAIWFAYGFLFGYSAS